MKNRITRTVWHNKDYTRHFLIPIAAEMSSGKLKIRNLLGREREVTENEALQYEVSKEEANAVVRKQIGQLFSDARDRVGEFMEKKWEERQAAAVEREKARTERGRRPFSAENISQGFQRILSDLPPEQKQKLEITGNALKTTFQQFAAMMEGTVAGDDAKVQAARARMDELRKSLVGQDVGKKRERGASFKGAKHS